MPKGPFVFGSSVPLIFFGPQGSFVSHPRDVLSPDVFSLRTLCPPEVLCPGRFVHPDVLSIRTFCPSGCFVPPDVLSLDVLSPDFASGRFVWVLRLSSSLNVTKLVA